MRVMMVGINHRTAGVDLRERLSLSGERLAETIDEFRRQYPQTEMVLLSTCNRTEMYIARPSHEKPTTDDLQAFLAALGGVETQALTEVLVQAENDAAVGHLFRVASGLESMVLGEPQVLGQVKRAYKDAVSRSAVGPTLHQVFQQAITIAKRVRTTTGIGEGRVSVGSVAVDFAKRIFERFDDKTIVGIGAGELAKPMLRHLIALNPAKLLLTNRSLDKAHAVAQRLNLTTNAVEVRAFDQLDSLLVEADVILTCTGSAEPIITAKRFKPLLKARRQRPLFVIDIAVPRDVEPAVGRLRNVYIYNIDDLQRVVEQTYDQRSDQALACEALLDDAVRACISQIQNQDIGQLIRLLKRRLQDLGHAEQQRTLRKLEAIKHEDIADAIPRIVEEHTHRLINKILHLPLSQLDHRQAESGLGFYAAALRRLFDLGEQTDTVHEEVELKMVGDESTPPQESENDTPKDKPIARLTSQSIDLESNNVDSAEQAQNKDAGNIKPRRTGT